MAGALENKERVKNYISSTGFPEDNQNQLNGPRFNMACDQKHILSCHIILTKNESFLRRVQILMAFPYDYRGPDSG